MSTAGRLKPVKPARCPAIGVSTAGEPGTVAKRPVAPDISTSETKLKKARPCSSGSICCISVPNIVPSPEALTSAPSASAPATNSNMPKSTDALKAGGVTTPTPGINSSAAAAMPHPSGIDAVQAVRHPEQQRQDQNGQNPHLLRRAGARGFHCRGWSGFGDRLDLRREKPQHQYHDDCRLEDPQDGVMQSQILGVAEADAVDRLGGTGPRSCWGCSRAG